MDEFGPAGRPVVPDVADDSLRRILDAKADVEVEKSGQEVHVLQQAHRDEVAARERAGEQERQERERAARLESLKSYGRDYAGQERVPTAWRARVVRHLESYVTLSQFPESLSDGQAREFIKASVEKVLDPYRQELVDQEGERRIAAKEQEDQRRIDRNISHGLTLGSLRTMGWDSDERREALADLEDELHDAVEVGWDSTDVSRFVDEFLSDDED